MECNNDRCSHELLLLDVQIYRLDCFIFRYLIINVVSHRLSLRLRRVYFLFINDRKSLGEGGVHSGQKVVGIGIDVKNRALCEREITKNHSLCEREIFCADLFLWIFCLKYFGGAFL